MSFGYVLKKFRAERNLSLRELGKLCEIDHAYIHRLERNEKSSPSDEVVEVFVRILKLSSRRAKLLRTLSGKIVNQQLVDIFIEDEDRPLELLEPLARMSFRGKRPKTRDDWRKKADLLNEFLDQNED